MGCFLHPGRLLVARSWLGYDTALPLLFTILMSMARRCTQGMEGGRGIGKRWRGLIRSSCQENHN